MHNNYTNKALFLHAILMCLNFENFATLWLKKGKNHVILLETKARGMFINKCLVWKEAVTSSSFIEKIRPKLNDSCRILFCKKWSIISVKGLCYSLFFTPL